MCGISGKFNFDGRPVDRSTFERQNDFLTHRGPNDHGVFVEGNAAIGSRRLSIIDLEGGLQPIANEDRSMWVVCNGEIYNYRELRESLKAKGHRFTTHSDTEVILHLYEQYQEDCVDKLRGIFAFAVWDGKKKKLFIARDHLGVKPLFYYLDDKRIVFASEIKAIIADPSIKREINREALYHYFSLNYVSSPLTMFKNIHSLLAGHCLVCSNRGVEKKQYWDISLNEECGEKENEIKECLKEKIDEVVKLQLVSDVPVGSFLSGGLDSSILVNTMRKHSNRSFKTFNVRFREASFDESKYAQLMAKHCGSEHHEIFCEAKDYLKYISEIIWHADNLTVDISMLPLYMVSKLASEQVKVVLSGDGADELFAGYPTYCADKYAHLYRKLPRILKDRWMPYLVDRLPVSEKKMSFDAKAKRFVYGARLNAQKAHFSWRLIFREEEKSSLINGPLFETQTEDSYWAYERFYRSNGGSDDLSRNQYADIKVWMVDSILAKVDLMSMANSLEVRVPYLDPQLVQFALSIPPHLRLKGFKGKYILKETFKKDIPAAVINREKAGFHIPIGKWLRGDLKSIMLDTLREDNIKKIGFLNWNFIEHMINEHLNLKWDYGYQLLSLMHFCLWYNRFIIDQDQVLVSANSGCAR